METCIYDWRKSRSRAHPYAWLVMLGLAIVFLAEFFSGISRTIEGDIHNFPPLWNSSPVLAILLASVKLFVYVFGGCLVSLMIFIPVSHFFCPRVIRGRFESVSTTVTDKGKSLLSIQMSDYQFHTSDFGDLETLILDPALRGQELRFTLGAFNRILRIERLS